MTANRVMEIVDRASRLALSRYGQERGELKADGTWVTRTDGMVEELLRSECADLFDQDAHIFGEEGGWSGSDSARYVVIIDPIEGTGPYRDEIPVWGVSVAIFRDGEPWLGVFSMPAAGQLFRAEINKTAAGEIRREAERIFNAVPKRVEPLLVDRPAIPTAATAYLGVSSDVHRWGLSRYPGKIRALGASGYHVVLTAAGVLQASFLTRFNFYDVAAGAIILWSAGGGFFYLSGEPVSVEDIITLQKPKDAVLACHPDYFEETRKYIQSQAAD